MRLIHVATSDVKRVVFTRPICMIELMSTGTEGAALRREKEGKVEGKVAVKKTFLNIVSSFELI